MRLLERIRDDLEPHGDRRAVPELEGRQMVMVLAPKKTLREEPHHPDKPEAGRRKRAKASPTSRRAPRVGSK